MVETTFLGGSWVPVTNTCTIASKITINGGNSLTVSQGATLEILDEIAIAYQSSLTNNGDINIVSGGHIGLNSFDNTSGNNMLTNNGNIINSGSIRISAYGNILTNFGSITNFGTFNNACEGSLIGTIPTSGNSVIQEESCNNTIQVNIDIKPGSFPNSINTNSMGVVPVSILGSNSFDVTQVDVTTLAFGPDGASSTHSAYEDVNGDEFVDLVSHYVQKETGIACGDTEATLTGQLND